MDLSALGCLGRIELSQLLEKKEAMALVACDVSLQIYDHAKFSVAPHARNSLQFGADIIRNFR